MTTPLKLDLSTPENFRGLRVFKQFLNRCWIIHAQVRCGALGGLTRVKKCPYRLQAEKSSTRRPPGVLTICTLPSGVNATACGSLRCGPRRYN
jgi:hypothetical protein